MTLKTPGNISWLGWLLSGAAIVAILVFVPLREIFDGFRTLDPKYAVGAAFLSAANVVLRGERWTAFFRTHRSLPPGGMMSPVMVGLALNALLPGKIGEVARIGMAMRKLKTGLAFTAATSLGDRLLDGISLLLIALTPLLMLPAARDALREGGYGEGPITTEMLMGAAFKTVVVCMVLIVFAVVLRSPDVRHIFLASFRRLPRVGNAIVGRLERAWDELNHGLRLLGRPAAVAYVLFLSLLSWLLVVFGNILLAHGMGGIDLGFREALLFTAMTILAASIPSAPGAWGVYEAGGLLSLKLLGVTSDPAVAVAYVLVTHACQYVSVVLLGLFASWRSELSLADIRSFTRRVLPRQSSMDRPAPVAESD